MKNVLIVLALGLNVVAFADSALNDEFQTLTAFNCAKAKGARLACIGVSTTDATRMYCNQTWCSTIRSQCESVPTDCLK